MDVKCWFKISPFRLSYLCSYTIPLELATIIDNIKILFPFEGNNFCFQLKLPVKDSKQNVEDFVWVNADCIFDDDIEIISTQPYLDVLISSKSYYETFVEGIWQCNATFNDCDLLEDACGISKYTQSNHTSSDNTGKLLVNNLESNQSLHSEYSSTLNLKIVTKGAVNLWKTITKATTEKHQTKNFDISVSHSTLESLERLSSMINSTFNYDNPDHQELLHSLWNIQILPLINKPIENVVESLKLTEWKLAGWQNPSNICIDLKTSGLLSIHSMIYFGRIYTTNSFSMLEANQQNTKYLYPYAIVAINLTLLLIDVFHLRDKRLVFNLQWFWFNSTSMYCYFFLETLPCWNHIWKYLLNQMHIMRCRKNFIC